MEDTESITHDDESIGSDFHENSCRSRTGSVKSKQLSPEEAIEYDAKKRRKKIRNVIGYITVLLLASTGILVPIIISVMKRPPIFRVTHPVTVKPVTTPRETRTTTTIITTTITPIDNCTRNFVALTKNMNIYVTSVTVADLNNDNNVDIIFICQSTSSIYIIFNLGNDKFDDPIEYEINNIPSSLTIADINDDNYLDIIIGITEPNLNLIILLNTGSRVFDRQINLNSSTTQPVTTVMVNDMDNDGKSDIIIGISDANIIGIYFNKNNVGFDRMRVYSVDKLPMSLYVADFNNDNNSDIVVVHTQSNTFSILFNQGNRRFSNRTSYSVDMGPIFVMAADMNKDNRSDIIILNFFSNNIAIYLNNVGKNFTKYTNFTAKANPLTIALIDFNNDNSIDIIVPNYHSNNIDVYFNNGDGTFTTAATYYTYPLPRHVAATDLNNDKKSDIVFSNGNYVATILSQCY